MRRILVAGNWKMHGSRPMVNDLLETLRSRTTGEESAELAVFPPFPYLQRTRKILQGSPITWGAQTLNPAPQGAYTGEVSASMLLDFGCRFVLVGHSERRSLYRESDEDVALRFEAAQQAGLEPVLCVGETLEEREGGQTEWVVARQLDAVINRCGIDAFDSATIAYEPVWAIGTGKTATPDIAQAVHGFIRDKLGKCDGIISSQIRILYGGSVNSSNAADLFAQDDIDGGLVGGASLQAEEFLAIREAAGCTPGQDGT
jgi:triosephosphate isomerase